jgi:hypothetical protein
MRFRLIKSKLAARPGHRPCSHDVDVGTSPRCRLGALAGRPASRFTDSPSPSLGSAWTRGEPYVCRESA